MTDYKRPKITLQDKLTVVEVKQKLEDYIKVDNIENVKLNSHIRYFTIKKQGNKNKKLFRLGGYLKNKTKADKYIILTNYKISWSVQVKGTVFFRKLEVEEIKEQYEDEILKLKKQVLKLKSKIKELKKN